MSAAPRGGGDPGPVLGPILERIGDPLARFVFPSEVAAASALAAALAESGLKALPSRRFVGWDAFKAEVFGGGPGRPSTRAVRSIFGRLIAAENAEAPFLAALVPPEASGASQRWASSIAAALPGLRNVPPGPGPLLADWREIRRRYASFMESAGMYEAAWGDRVPTPSPWRWVFIYTDLTEDWEEYSDAALSLPGAEATLSEALGDGLVKAAAFSTVVEEFRAILARIKDELASGADPAGIAISVASPEAALPILRREAFVAGVPLDLRGGSPLSEGPGGRLFKDLVEFSRSGASFESARRLLLDRSRAWKDDAAARRLIGLGIRAHIVGPLPEGPDLWESAAAGDDAARRFYKRLKGSAASVAGAASFPRLKAAFDDFKRSFLDESRWTAEQDEEIARCVAALDELSDAAEAVGLGKASLPWAPDAYLDALSRIDYVPVSRSAGIAVYRFPVAAGAMPELHFVANLGESDARAAARPLSFLRADERERAGAGDRDFSGGLVRLLSASGRRVVASWAEDGPDGIRPLHPALVAAPPSELGLAYDRARWTPDAVATGTGPGTGLPASPPSFPVIVEGAKAALRTVFGPDGADWASGRPGRPVSMGAAASRAVLAALSTDGPAKLTATTIEGYRSCPFRQVYGGHLGVEASESGLGFVDARLIGVVYHEAFRRLFRPMADAGKAVEEAGADDEAEAALGAAIADIGARLGPMVAALLGTAYPSLKREFIAAYRELAAALDGWTPELVDSEELSAPFRDGQARLAGRPDLVCVRPGQGRAALVDFKKRRVPSNSDLRPDQDGEVAALQMPIYTVLLAAAGLEPGDAWYVSIEGYGSAGKRLLKVYGDGGAVSPGERGRFEEAAWRGAERTLDLVAEGGVFLPEPADRIAVCERCDLRPLCRVHYAVR